MLSKQNQAILLMVNTKATKDKGNQRFKTEKFGTAVPKTELERIALVDASNGWAHLRKECVLLKRKG